MGGNSYQEFTDSHLKFYQLQALENLLDHERKETRYALVNHQQKFSDFLKQCGSNDNKRKKLKTNIIQVKNYITKKQRKIRKMLN